MNVGVTVSSLIIILVFSIWVVSEIILANSIKKSKKDDSIWLAINILLPVVGCIIYKLTHKTIGE